MYVDPDGRCPTCETGEEAKVIYAQGAIVENQNGKWQFDNGDWIDMNATSISQNANSNMGVTDFTNANFALTTGGELYGLLEGIVAGEDYWLGQNGKYYSNMTGREPNQYTGSRTAAINTAQNYRLAGRVTVAGSVLLGGYATYEGYVADGGQFGYNAQVAAISTTGGIIGGMAGAKGGALVGAGVGVWFGGVGALPGAVIGGFIGGIAGSIGGGYAGEGAVNYYHGRGY